MFNSVISNNLNLLCHESYYADPGRCIHKFVPYFNSYKRYKQKTMICDSSGNTCTFYILVSEKDRTIIIVFTGSPTFRQTFSIMMTYFYKKVNFLNSGFVNKYFLKTLNVLWPHIEKVFHEKKFKFFSIYVTGHSFGGALATLAAYKIQHHQFQKSEHIYLYTFGQPRVGSYEFSKNFNKKIPNSYRVVYRTDSVPHFPPCKKDIRSFSDKLKTGKSFPCSTKDLNSYYHHGVEIWYSEIYDLSSNYKICLGYPKNEDFSCSDQFNYDLKTYYNFNSDHDAYFRPSWYQYGVMFKFAADENCYITNDEKRKRANKDFKEKQKKMKNL